MGKAIIGKKLGMTQLFDQESGIVTAVTSPLSSSKSCVMPSFLPTIPFMSELDLDVDSRREIEPHQLVDRLRRR